MSECIAIVDANNFFVSCERIFQPKLWGRPVIVLSNNDGCAVARSNEAKALGIKMAQPFFQIKDLVKKHDIAVFSSNFSLYAEISARITDILMQSAPDVINYSIDECFVNLTSLQQNYAIEKFCQQLVKKVYRYVGVPVTIGVASSKTLAKIANHIAKKLKVPSHVLYLQGQEQVDSHLKGFELNNIWGIGKKWSEKLNNHGYKDGLQLKQANSSLIKQQFNVVLAKTVQELQGFSCIKIDDLNATNKQIIASRSFGKAIANKADIKEALANHVARASLKLREQNAVTSSIVVTLQTNMHGSQEFRFKIFHKKN